MLLILHSLLVSYSLAYLCNLNRARYIKSPYRISSEGETGEEVEEYVPFKYAPRPRIIIEQQPKRPQNFYRKDSIITLSPLISIAPKKRAKNIAYNSLEDVAATCRNKLLALYTTMGPNNWHAKISRLGNVEEYYAICLTCTWDKYSKAFIKTIKQIHNYEKIDRDPPILGRRPPPPKFEDVLKEYREEERIFNEYLEKKKECKLAGTDPPDPPDFRPVVTFKFSYPFSEIQGKVLEYVERVYGVNYIEPDYWRLVFNKQFNKLYNRLYNELPYYPTSPVVEGSGSGSTIKLVNFIMAPITDSQVIKNRNRINRHFKDKMYSHAKQVIFHEILLKLLIESDIKASHMPVIALFKYSGSDDFNSLVTDENKEALEAARMLDYKCEKLKLDRRVTVDQFELVSMIGGFSSITDPPKFKEMDEMISKNDIIPLPWESNPLDPLLSLIYMSYQYHLKRLIYDARPKYYYKIYYPKKRI